MSKVLSVVGAVASIAALIPGPHQAAARVVATVASVGSAVLAKPPPAKGSVNQVQIGANMPTPYAIGRTYIGGNMVHDVGYGGSNNPYKSMVFVWSGGGPVNSIEAFLGDFSPLTFSGGNAVGYYHDYLYLTTSPGAKPQSSALAGPFGAIPGWGSTAKLSGKAHGLITTKFDKKGKKFASGLPQFGVVLEGVFAWDPRLDSTYPGGSGPQRFDDESTWAWTENPALHALAYARGRYENDKKVFGCGFPKEAIDIAAFVAHANICDANGWTVGGVIYEPGSRKDNLKYILEAGAGEPVFGAQLSVRYSAPKVALDTITAVDLADGDYVVPAMRSWRDRLNGIIPKYRSEAHKWEYVQSDAVSVEAYVEEDGEEKQEERQFSLVQDKDQAAQLASYALVNGREFGPIVLPCKPRLSAYSPGEALEVDIPELGLNGQLCEVVQREIDPGTSIVTLTLVSETGSKHAFALGQSGTAPPTPTITAPDVIDELISANSYRSAPHVVASEAEMVALEVTEGEVAIRTDLQTTFIHNGGTTGTAADWTEALSPPVTTFTDEQAQDAVGSILSDSTTIDLTYADGTPSISASVVDGSLGTVKLGGDITTAGKALLDDASAAAQRTTLGLATVASTGSAADLSGTLSNLRLDAFTGDATKAAGSGVLTLATVNSNTGTYGGAATVPQFSVDGKGRITGVTAVPIVIAFSALTSVPTTLAGHNITLTSSNVTTALGYTPVDAAAPTFTGAGSSTHGFRFAGSVIASGGPAAEIYYSPSAGGFGVVRAYDYVGAVYKNLGLYGASILIVPSSGLTQFAGSIYVQAGLELGHLSDTTLSRVSAGDIAVEGNLIYRAAGTDVPLADGGTGASLADPNADRILFWDDSLGQVTWLSLGNNLSITGTVLDQLITGVGLMATCLPSAARYIPPDMLDFGTGVTGTHNASSISYTLLSRRATITALAIEVVTAAAAGSTARLALYRSNGSRGRPGTLIEDLGTQLVDSTGIKEFPLAATSTIDEPVWLAMQTSVTMTNGLRGGVAASSTSHHTYGSDTLSIPATVPMGILDTGPAYGAFPSTAALAGTVTFAANVRMIAAKLAV